MITKLSNRIDRVNEKLGELSSWLLLFMVGLTFLILVLRYAFGLGWVWMQELVIYAHAFLFLVSMGWALHNNAHVRVDIYYQKATNRVRCLVDGLGACLLALPTCVLVGYQSSPYVFDSWKVLEGSKDGGGLEGVFILKSFILVFVILTGLQSLSLAMKSFQKWTSST